jgi:hypothetical protein
MLDVITQEVGCDECSVATASGEDDARYSAWLVDTRGPLHRHICPVCLALAEAPATADTLTQRSSSGYSPELETARLRPRGARRWRRRSSRVFGAVSEVERSNVIPISSAIRRTR